MSDPGLKQQIDEWLRQSDKCIREGRYIAADEFLQKVFHAHPENTTARMYQDRIQFLINQLSQRIGLRGEIQTEVRKYKELIVYRKSNQIDSLLVAARKYLEDGYFNRCNEQITKILALDPENVYAKTLKERLSELKVGDDAGVLKEREYGFRALLKESWSQGAPTAAQREIIAKVQTDIKINDEVRAQLERDARNALYKEALQEIWVAGGLSAFNDETIDNLRSKFEISRLDHTAVEAELLREVRKNKLRGTILLVDGNDANLRELSRMLRLNSFAVAAAIDPEEAFATLKITVPDIILSEVNFANGASGFDLFQVFRSSTTTKHIPFFFISASFDRMTKIVGRRLGVDDFIVKPIDGEMLLATIAGKLLQREKQPTVVAKK